MENDKVSLSDLGVKPESAPVQKPAAPVEDAGKYKKVNMSDFVTIKKHESPQDEFQRKEMKLIDDGIERTKKDMMENIIRPFKEACVAASLEDEANKLGGVDESSSDDLEAQLETQSREMHKMATKKDTSSKDDDLAALLSEEDNEGEINMSTNHTKPATTFVPDPDDEVKQEPAKVEAPKVEKRTAPVIPPSLLEEDKVEKEEAAPVEAVAPEVHTPELPKFEVPEETDHQERIADDDLSALLDTESEVEIAETEEEKALRKERLQAYKKEVFAALGMPATIDKDGIKKFRISTKPVSVNKILKTSTAGRINTATWVLPNTGRLITFSGLSGEEIENLNPDAHDRDMSPDMANRLIFNTLYEHVVDPNKPATMEEWAKTINWFDSNDLYFAQYLGTFKNSNFVTYACPKDKCHHLSLNAVNYDDMVVYADDKAKDVYKHIFKTGVDMTPGEVPEDIVPINDKFAIGFRAPSVFDIIFGTSTLDRTFLDKYATTIGNISYMSNVYYINGDTLFPVDCKAVKDNPAKTVRNKIVAYYNILKTLSPDEYSVVSRSINEINDSNRIMASFRYPDAKCAKCGTEIKMDASTNPLSMLFTRHQLVPLASSMTV